MLVLPEFSIKGAQNLFRNQLTICSKNKPNNISSKYSILDAMQFSIQTIGLTILATISVLPGVANAQGSSGREDLCATYECHQACGLMIIEGQKCSQNTTDSFSGPYTNGCLCKDDFSTPFQQNYNECLECGWTLWKYYSPYLGEALAQCAKEVEDYPATEPTGTLRCTTTLTDTYTRDPDIDYTTFLTSTTSEAI